ncbi:MAG TPA: MFS transporter [Propionibacteriaceae bacterium]|nr:MFS transporter [Propionibacteriaceae bacterium]
MTWRPWAMWGIAVFAYVAAVLQRTSFGIAGLVAAERFSAPASVVATFVVVQILVYAGMQVPAGLLVDRFGTRAIVTTGAVIMALGQVNMAFAESVPSALVARFLVGAGDAMTFTSVLKLVPAWFPDKRIPLMTQLTGLTGQLGQLASSIPLAAILASQGWTVTFLVAASMSVLGAILVATFVRDRPPGVPAPPPHVEKLKVWGQVRQVWAHPGTQLGFWTHFTSGFSGLVFAMMWGFPYLTRAQGMSPGLASGYFTIFVVGSLVAGPFFGVFTQRHPLRRSNLALFVIGLQILGWVAVLLFSTPAPRLALAFLMICLAVGGPGSSIGFDFARTANPQRRMGTATGLVIMGAFTAAFTCILAVGLVLDLVGRGSYSYSSFRVAMAIQLLWFALGITMMFITRTRLRARMRDEGVVVPPWSIALRRTFRGRPGSDG